MTTSNLAEEWCDDLVTATNGVLRDMGGHKISNSWGVGGSQEVEVTKWRLGWRTIIVEAETYIGLTITGPDELVRQIADEVARRSGS
jgi:hypothetical protein